MSLNEKAMILICCLYSLASGMSAVFMNVYLYAYTKSLIVMTIYTMIRIGMFPLFFTLGGKYTLKHRFSHTLSAGLLFLMAQLLFVLLFNQQLADHPNLVYVAALFYGIGEGLYWFSVNSLHQIVSSSQTRSYYCAQIGVFNNVANIAAPLLAALIIDYSGSDFAGYIHIFEGVLVIFGGIALLSLKVTARSDPRNFSVRRCLFSHGDKQWHYAIVSTILYGMRDSLTLTLSGLLVYNATGGSGGAYSRLLALFAIVTIVSYQIVGKVMKRGNRMIFYRIGSYLLASSTIVLVLWPTLGGAIYFGIVNAIALPMYTNPWTIISMNGIQDYAAHENIVGRVIVREIWQSFGRCLGMLCIVICFLLLPSQWYLEAAVIFCSSFAVILSTYATLYHRKRDRLKAAGKL